MGMSSETHSGTILSNTGPGSAPAKLIIMETEAGARTLSGAAQTIQSARSTDEICNAGDLIKYLNIFIQVAPRDVAPTADRNGWLEWAMVTKREADVDIPSSQTGVSTLATIATRMYRNECVYTGFIPVGAQQANGQSISIKIPKPKQKIKIGDTFVLFTYFRGSSAADVSTDTLRLLTSYMYKCYH